MSKSMNKTTLTFALVIQLAIVGLLWAARAGGVAEPAPFLSFDAEAVDSLTIGNEEGTVTLTKIDDSWQLLDGIPADESKIDEVVEKLAKARGGWPVATQASSAERFEVTEDSHQRHLTLAAGDETVAELYLGTSPGYRKTHARLVDEDDVYAINFSNYEAAVNAEDWLDKTLMRASAPISSLELLDAFTLSKDDEGNWSSADGTALDQGKVETLVGRFTGLSVLGVSEVALPEQPKAVFQLADDGGAFKFSLYHDEEEDSYMATSDRVAGVYEISSYIGGQMDTTLADLMVEEVVEEEDESGDEDDTVPAATAEEEPAEADSAEAAS